MPDVLQMLPAYVPVKWLTLLMPLFPLILWHHRQHQVFGKRLPEEFAPLFREVLRSFRRRSIQLAGVWIVAVLLIIGQDLRYYRLLSETPPPPRHEPEAKPEATAAPEFSASSAPAQENRIDDLKFRYEDAFVSFFYLQRCKHADITDLSVINEALAREAKAVGATSDVQFSIFSAAQGSFESIYADTPCDAEYLDPIIRQFEAFMRTIR